MKGNSTIIFIGLDVHSKTISVAIADEGRRGEVRHYGTTLLVANNICFAPFALCPTHHTPHHTPQTSYLIPVLC